MNPIEEYYRHPHYPDTIKVVGLFLTLQEKNKSEQFFSTRSHMFKENVCVYAEIYCQPRAFCLHVLLPPPPPPSPPQQGRI